MAGKLVRREKDFLPLPPAKAQGRETQGLVTATTVIYKGRDGRQYLTASDTGGSRTGRAVLHDEMVVFAVPKT